MGIANPRIHMICGLCGCKDMLQYEVVEDAEGQHIFINCENCSSITDLGEVIGKRDRND